MNIEPDQLCEIVPCETPSVGGVIEKISAIFFTMCIEESVGQIVSTVEPCDVEAAVKRIIAQKRMTNVAGLSEAIRAAKAFGMWWHIIDDATGAHGYRPACCLRPLPSLEFTLHREEEATA